MKLSGVAMLVLLLATTAQAGPLLETAKANAARMALTVTQPEPVEGYQKSGGRKWLEWIGLIGGGLMAMTTQEECVIFSSFPQGTTSSVCETSWYAPIGGPGLGIFTAALVSKLMPDPE